MLYYNNFFGFKISNPEYESVWIRSKTINVNVQRLKNIPEDMIISHADSQTFVSNKSHVFMVDAGDRIFRFKPNKKEIVTDPSNHHEILIEQGDHK